MNQHHGSCWGGREQSRRSCGGAAKGSDTTQETTRDVYLYLIADPVVNDSLKEELWGYHL